jgi:hypothetical protein
LQGSQVLLVNALLESLAAFILLKERFNDPWKYLGIILIIIGLFFLKIPLKRVDEFKFPKLF